VRFGQSPEDETEELASRVAALGQTKDEEGTDRKGKQRMKGENPIEDFMEENREKKALQERLARMEQRNQELNRRNQELAYLASRPPTRRGSIAPGRSAADQISTGLLHQMLEEGSPFNERFTEPLVRPARTRKAESASYIATPRAKWR
jgi:hypothetical protein